MNYIRQTPTEARVKAEAKHFKEKALASEIFDRYIEACTRYRELLAEEMRRSPIGEPSSTGYLDRAEANNEQLAEAAEELEAARADFDKAFPKLAEKYSARV